MQSSHTFSFSTILDGLVETAMSIISMDPFYQFQSIPVIWTVELETTSTPWEAAKDLIIETGPCSIDTC
jgi:hypothetical protein